MPKCPICNHVHKDANVGIRLFQSENTCAICLEKDPHMVVIPCGHQFCKKDILKIGFKIGDPFKPKENALRRPVSSSSVQRSRHTLFISHPGPIRAVMPRRIRRVGIPVSVSGLMPPALSSRLRRRRRTYNKRCGWCGRRGHELRKCLVHVRECGCRSGARTRRHHAKLKAKRVCGNCKHRGHLRNTCARIVTYN